MFYNYKRLYNVSALRCVAKEWEDALQGLVADGHAGRDVWNLMRLTSATSVDEGSQCTAPSL